MNIQLLQISDSALPVGGYTHSWGLETAINRGLVHDAASLEDWSRAWLVHLLAPLEGVVVASTVRAVQGGDREAVLHANAILTAAVAPPTIRAASLEMGDQLHDLAATWEWSRPTIDTVARTPIGEAGWHGWNHAVIFGVLGAAADASPAETLLAYLHQAVNGVVTAGVRAVPVGHTHGQQVLSYLHPDIKRLAAAFSETDLARAGSSCPQYEVLCDEQTRLYARLFRS